MIEFRCPKGHKLRAETRHAGSPAKCPRCQTTVIVPEAPRPTITDTGVFRMLSDSQAGPVAQSPAQQLFIDCPRCRKSLPTSARACSDCGLYLSGYTAGDPLRDAS